MTTSKLTGSTGKAVFKLKPTKAGKIKFAATKAGCVAGVVYTSVYSGRCFAHSPAGAVGGRGSIRRRIGGQMRVPMAAAIASSMAIASTTPAPTITPEITLTVACQARLKALRSEPGLAGVAAAAPRLLQRTVIVDMSAWSCR